MQIKLSEKAREQIHNAVQIISPFNKQNVQAKVNMGAALETKTMKAMMSGNRSAHVYAGTANSNDVRKRRAKNKVARKSRRNNRG
jgi:hypothetical protein